MTQSNPKNSGLIKRIAGRILEDRCIIVCGSELSALADERYQNTKIAETLLQAYPDQFPELIGNCPSKPLSEVIQLWINTSEARASGDQDSVDHISLHYLNEIIDLEKNPSVSHMILANLGCRSIYTTNYDGLIEKAYLKAGFPPGSINVVSENASDTQFRFEFPVVYKLCGTAGRKKIKLADRQFTPERIRFRDEMKLRLLRRTIIFIGYNQNDNSMLSPFVDIIRDSCPEGYFCVTQPASIPPCCLSTLGPAMRSLEMNIGDFFSQIYLELLSQTSDLFGYFCTKRWLIERSAITYLRNHIGSLEEEKIKNIKRALDEHQRSMDNPSSFGNAWYWDFLFHQSLFKSLPVQTFLKDFSKIYLKLRVFFSMYQSKATYNEHHEIYQKLAVRDVRAAQVCLNRHLRNVIVTAAFWLQYFKIINRDIIQLALHDYRSPLESDRGMLDQNQLHEHSKILVLGESNSGKTTYSVRQVILSITTISSIPIYIDFGSDRFGADEITRLSRVETLPQFLLEYFKIFNLSSMMMSQIIDEKVENGGLLLIFDGIEKVDPKLAYKLLRLIPAFLSTATALRVIVTSLYDFTLDDGTSAMRLSEIIDFEDQEIFMLSPPILKTIDLAGTDCTLAIVFTDIIGSVGLVKKSSEYSELLNRHKDSVGTQVVNFKGEWLRDEGDAHLAIFRNVSSALDYVINLQSNTGDTEVRIRAAIHFGEVRVEGPQKINGLEVAYAKRLIESIESKDAEILLSSDAKAHIEQQRGLRHRQLEWAPTERVLEGFEEKPPTLWKLQLMILQNKKSKL